MSVENTNKFSFGDTMANMKSNEYTTMAFVIGLIILTALVVPRLPAEILMLFDNTIIKILIFVLIAYCARQNPTVGIIMAVCLLIIMQNVNQYKVERKMNYIIAVVQKEHMSNMDTVQNMQNQEMDMQMDMDMGNSMFVPNMHVNPDSARIIGGESKKMKGCDVKMKYRNDNYQQFENLDPETYHHRYSTSGTMGTDDTCVANDSQIQTPLADNDGGYVASNAQGLAAYSGVCGFSSI
jgi:hypothetical protein